MGFGAVEPMIFKTQSEFLEKISKWNFSINPLTKTNLDQVEKQHEMINQNRSKLNYDIDGIVYKVNDLKFKVDWVIPQILQDGQLHINFQPRRQ